ncbi:threonyl-tRNA synthase [Ureaplasma diversum]|uniref:Threonine--tRNA ligase n=2 Tax=Ureaplasma diversum TaxID=42094 RepID=A0A084EZD7_9BACT|nr:threonine--tRNA ligase [Ureaplasma diversum]AJQ45095.1 threonyl-tRNA synthase [Ureaplasma diversum]KEZ23329.1 Threonyl-tRNA synthetase [Ureaplasma diversum NCTC 246]
MYKFDSTLSHSAAHVLAMALVKLYPNISLAIGPAIDEGFYYDFNLNDPNTSITTKDLARIEKEMKKIVDGAYDFIHEDISYEDAKKAFANNKYKLEIIEKYKEQGLTISRCANWFDLCGGPHVANTKLVKAFKLLNVAGAYWHGDAKNDQLIRIYGCAFYEKSHLDAYLAELAERKERDHRKIGKDLNLFTFNQLAGQGLPIWLANGTIIKQEVQRFINQLEFKYNFDTVITPILGSIDLYKTSGHWDHYHENMFKPIKIDNEELVLRPMTCPHHTLVYANELRSYRSLPVRLSEHSILHRYESSGGLTGFERVRSMILEDCHVFCRIDQIEQEVLNAYAMIKAAQEGLGIKTFEVHLSLNDPDDKEKYFNDPQMWEQSQAQLREMLNKNNIEYKEIKGEAAFYGPKIDFQAKTVLNRIITISTIQLDFLLPRRFDLKYIDEQNNQITPVMIHIGIIGTYERFLSILLEQTKGILPLWLAPVQVVIIPVNENAHGSYASELHSLLRANLIRANLDLRNERLSKKIREAQIQKVPYQIVVGDEEIKNNKMVTYRKYGQENTTTVKYEEFIALLTNQIKDKH